MNRIHIVALAALAGAAALFASEAADAGRWWSHVVFLADDRLEGRETGSGGHKQAARYVAQEFERAGLKPAGTHGYRQPVRFRSQSIDESKSSIEIERNGKWERLELGEDAFFNLRSSLASKIEAPLAFAGYGFAVDGEDFDEFAGLDLKGKVVIYVTGGPPHIPGPLLSHSQSASERWRRLREAGAIGFATISHPKSTDIPWSRAKLARLMPQMRLAGAADDGPQLALRLNPDRSEKIFDGSPHTLAALLALAADGKPLPKFAMPAKIRARARVSSRELESDNVAGLIEGSDPVLRREYVVLSAHLDHIGAGGRAGDDRIYNGAMDNAAGIATLIDVAQRLRGVTLKRSVLFVAVTGEEKGLLGSQYFARFPTVPQNAIAADLNCDMFLPLYPLQYLTVLGLDESTLGDAVRQVGAKMGVEIQTDPEPQRNAFIRSDQYSFIREGIPSLAFKVGYKPGTPQEQIFKAWLKERYHAPSDDITQPVDKVAAVRFNTLLAALATTVANDPQRPHWKQSSFFRRFAR